MSTLFFQENLHKLYINRKVMNINVEFNKIIFCFGYCFLAGGISCARFLLLFKHLLV